MDREKPNLRTLQEFIRRSLTVPITEEDPISECGTEVLASLPQKPKEARKLADEKLHVFPFKGVHVCWRRLYTDASLWEIVQFEEEVDWPTAVVTTLDMTLIMTGAPLRQILIEETFEMLEDILDKDDFDVDNAAATIHVASNGDIHPPSKRRKLDKSAPRTFPKLPVQNPPLLHPLPRLENPSLSAFQTRLSEDHKPKKSLGPLPLIITGALTHWPALDASSNRSWHSSDYLLKKTLGGRRLVPIEIGRSYTDESWGQRIITFGEFMQNYMLDCQDEKAERTGTAGSEREIGYLAQHDLFAQIPSLRNDIAIPDYCYSVPPEPSPSSPPAAPPNPEEEEEQATTDTPILLNAWFGPANTTSPLHTDPHHNILAQAVGRKYVRLYAPSQTPFLYPRGINEDTGVDESNTSQIDIEVVMRCFEGREFGTLDGKEMEGRGDEGGDGEGEDVVKARKWAFEQEFPEFSQAVYVEGVLEEGECLFIPKGWWHYIRSLSPSFSVSFWWD
jgi:hypothetical protein